MSTSVNNIRVYDPSAPKVATTSDPTSTQDLSANFLKLLTVQLQNQDPMNPMDNAAMTSQLAQLNTVDGINKLNTSISAMIAQMQSANFMNLSGSVGKMALAAGSGVYYAGQPVSMAARLDTPAASLKAVIRDAKGQEITQMDLGAADAGVTDFFWDGRDSAGQAVAQGSYRLELTAADANGKSLLPEAFVGSMVASVGMDGTDLMAGLSDGRKVLTTDILKWLAF